MFVNETFLTLYMTVDWHREFAVNFATFLKVCRDFFTFAPWFSYSPRYIRIGEGRKTFDREIFIGALIISQKISTESRINI